MMMELEMSDSPKITRIEKKVHNVEQKLRLSKINHVFDNATTTRV